MLVCLKRLFGLPLLDYQIPHHHHSMLYTESAITARTKCQRMDLLPVTISLHEQACLPLGQLSLGVCTAGAQRHKQVGNTSSKS